MSMFHLTNVSTYNFNTNALFRVDWEEPITVTFKNEDHLYTAPPPGSGVILGFILNILDGYGFNRESLSSLNSTILTYHRIIEAFKYAYAKRTELGDTKFINITEVRMLNYSISPEGVPQESIKSVACQKPIDYSIFYDI